MKRILIIVPCLLLCLSVRPQLIVSDGFAKSFLGGDVKLAYVARTDGLSDFYVFNRADRQGYVILSADEYDGEQIVIGYSDDGTFDYDNLPDNARWWLGQYQKQIEQARKEHIRLRAPQGTADGAGGRHIVIHPLLGQVRWVQTYPFHNKTPKKYNVSSKKDENCPVGCVAVAMGEVMYYYRWPLNPTGSHSYKWNGQTLSSDFSKSEYDWAMMKDKYLVYHITPEEANAISSFMYDCGVAVNMDYDLGSSGAIAPDVPKALKNYFRYKSANLVYRNKYNADQWDDVLRQQLTRFQPVIYTGQGDDGGHAFVCDGFDSEGYFHFCFGWGGKNDGYYLSALSDSYRDEQGIICDIVPDRQKYKYGELYYNHLNSNSTELSYPEGSSSGYSGNVKVPDTVPGGYDVISVGCGAFMNSSVSKVELPSAITRISGYAFASCTELDTLVVNWNSPLDCDVSVFDNRVYSNTVLVVPAGKVDIYSSVLPWSLFSHITDKSASQEWSEWMPMECGTGKYSSGFYIFGPSEVSVQWRVSDKDRDKAQIKIDGVFTGASLMVDVNLRTGACRVPKQSTGCMNGSDEIIISDAPSFSDGYTYRDYPCVYDGRLGALSLYVIYSSAGHPGGYYAGCMDALMLDMNHEWKEKYTGAYYYKTYVNQTRSNVKLYQDVSRPYLWRLYPMQGDTELVFAWNEDDKLEFIDQDSGFRSGDDGVILIGDLKRHQLPAESSHYDSAKKILYFNTYYSAPTPKSGIEAYVIDSESAVDDIPADTWKGDMIYNVAGQHISTPSRGINISDGYKFLIE